jgi:hypothetical protein
MSSNLLCSSGESGTNRTAAAGDMRAPMQGRRKKIAKTVACSRQTTQPLIPTGARGNRDRAADWARRLRLLHHARIT